MIGPDDIRAFEEAQSENLNEAAEYYRRYLKGLPTDRFTDGAAGSVRVARGIAALVAWGAAWQALAVRAIDDATHPHKDPMRPE